MSFDVFISGQKYLQELELRIFKNLAECKTVSYLLRRGRPVENRENRVRINATTCEVKLLKRVEE
jgi:hypothetical protein